MQPFTQAISVTPNDTIPLTNVPHGLYVGGAGDLTVKSLKDNQPVTFKNVPAGSFIPYRGDIIMNTNTTATNILALY